MSFLTPKIETGVNTGDNTPGRNRTQSPRQAIPLVLGRGRVAAQWVSPVLNWRRYGSDRTSFASVSIYGWLCFGPVDEFVNIIVNDQVHHTPSKHRGDYPGSHYVDEVTVYSQRTEKFRLYWGTEDGGERTSHLQSLIDPSIAPDMVGKTYPYDLGICAIAIDGLEVGRMDGQWPSLPKVEVEVYRRSPAAYSFGYSPKGTHPVGIVKDLLTLKRGGRGLPASMFDDDDWTAKMQRLMDDGVATMKGTDLFLSLVAAEPKETDQYVADVLAYIGGWLVDRNGKLYLDWQPNDGSSLDETGLRVISEHNLADEDVDEDPGDLEALPSQVIVTGLDWTANPPLTEASESAPVPFVDRLVAGRREPEPMNRPGFTERRQLKSYAIMIAGLLANPDSNYTVPLLRQYAMQLDGVTPLRPGDRFVLNLTNNGGKRVMVRITERSSEDAVKVVLKCQRERGTYPKPAQPVLDPRVDPTIDPPADLARFTVAQLPPDLSDAADTVVAALVERSAKSSVSFEVQMSPTNSWPGQVISSGNTRFAICAVLQTAMASGVGAVTVNVNAVGNDWDQLRSQSTLEQSDDQLMVWHAGEWMSIGTITPFGGGSYSLALLRARLGSLPAAHAVGQVLFIISRGDLVAVTHADFANVESGGAYNAGVATKWFKLRPVGGSALQGNLTAAFSMTLRDPTPDAPGNVQARQGTGKIVELNWDAVTAALVGEYKVFRATGPGFSDEAEIGETGGTRFYDAKGLTFGGTYRYRVKSVSTDETLSGFSLSASVTLAYVDDSEVDPTPPDLPGQITLNATGSYLADDGATFAYIQLNVPAMPVGAAWQDILIRRNGSSEWLIKKQDSNTGAIVVRIDDLVPGQNYDFALQAFSTFAKPSAVRSANGIPYGAPAGGNAPAKVTGVVLAAFAGYNGLTWNRSPEKNVAEYAIYKNSVNNRGTATQIGENDGNFWDDDAVVEGDLAYYWIEAVTRAEVHGPASDVVSVVAAPAPLDATPPADPTAATKTGQGTYLSGDGTVLAYLEFSVPARPANSRWQNILYRRNVAGEFMVRGQLRNPATATFRLDDLMPGVTYQVATQAWAPGSGSNVVLANSSPFTAPGKTATPNAPTTGSLAPDSVAPAVKSDLSNVLFGCRVNVTAPTDSDVAAIEIKATFTDADGAIDCTWDDFSGGGRLMRVTATPGQQVSRTIYNYFLQPGFVRARTIDRSGNPSDWLSLGNANGNAVQAIKPMALQSPSAVAITGGTATGITNLSTTGITIGSGGSQRKVLARQPIYAQLNVAGGAATETIDFSLSGFGFSTRPDSGWMQSADWDRMLIRYDIDDSTSTNAKLRLSMADGSNLPAVSNMEVTGEFLEYD